VPLPSNLPWLSAICHNNNDDNHEEDDSDDNNYDVALENIQITC
jgi:hypothetical protein